MSTLQGRLQNIDYKNWLKAGLCLIYSKEGLEDFANTKSQQLHQNVLANVASASITNTVNPICGISINRHRKLINQCTHAYCKGFLTAVMQEGLDPNHPFTIRPANLANTDVGLWHSQHWELAKLYMNFGQLPTQTDPSETDLSGIINFLSHCRVSRSDITNDLLIDEVTLVNLNIYI